MPGAGQFGGQPMSLCGPVWQEAIHFQPPVELKMVLHEELGLDANEINVVEALLGLLHEKEDTGRRASERYLARRAGLPRGSAQDAIKRLVEKGLLRIVDPGSKRPNSKTEWDVEPLVTKLQQIPPKLLTKEGKRRRAAGEPTRAQPETPSTPGPAHTRAEAYAAWKKENDDGGPYTPLGLLGSYYSHVKRREGRECPDTDEAKNLARVERLVTLMEAVPNRKFGASDLTMAALGLPWVVERSLSVITEKNVRNWMYEAAHHELMKLFPENAAETIVKKPPVMELPGKKTPEPVDEVVDEPPVKKRGPGKKGKPTRKVKMNPGEPATKPPAPLATAQMTQDGLENEPRDDVMNMAIELGVSEAEVKPLKKEDIIPEVRLRQRTRAAIAGNGAELQTAVRAWGGDPAKLDNANPATMAAWLAERMKKKEVHTWRRH